MKNKVTVPSPETLREIYPHIVNVSKIEESDLKTLIITTLYVKGLLGERKVLISKLGKGYDRKDTLRIYEIIMSNKLFTTQYINVTEKS